jgi:transposase
VLVDTNGFLLGISVTEASVQDRDGARDLLSRVLVGSFGWLKRIWADGGYAGQLVEDIASLPRHRKVELEIVKRSDIAKGFKVLPKRWIVERTFGWLVRNRRLIRDFEVLPEHSVAMIQVAMIKLMLRRIAC